MSDPRTEALENAVRRFGDAWAGGDLATLERLLSPTYTHTDAFGAIQQRSEWLKYAQGRSGRTTRIAFRDVEARIIGDVAVVTGVNELQGPGIRNATDRQGLTIRFTQVWVWSNGRWLREAFQATPVEARTFD